MFSLECHAYIYDRDIIATEISGPTQHEDNYITPRTETLKYCTDSI